MHPHTHTHTKTTTIHTHTLTCKYTQSHTHTHTHTHAHSWDYWHIFVKSKIFFTTYDVDVSKSETQLIFSCECGAPHRPMYADTLTSFRHIPGFAGLMSGTSASSRVMVESCLPLPAGCRWAPLLPSCWVFVKCYAFNSCTSSSNIIRTNIHPFILHVDHCSLLSKKLRI